MLSVNIQRSIWVRPCLLLVLHDLDCATENYNRPRSAHADKFPVDDRGIAMLGHSVHVHSEAVAHLRILATSARVSGNTTLKFVTSCNPVAALQV